jgi:hypothetical protein
MNTPELTSLLSIWLDAADDCQRYSTEPSCRDMMLVRRDTLRECANSLERKIAEIAVEK